MLSIAWVFGAMAVTVSAMPQEIDEFAVGSALPEVELEADMVCGDDREGGRCKVCKHNPPKGFPFAPCPVDTFLQGSLKLGGDVNWGRMTLSIDAAIRNACPRNQKYCQRARLDVKNFHINKIVYSKHKDMVVQYNPPTSHGCSVCDIILTYPGSDITPVPPPPGCGCDIASDFIAAVDVSKSMSQPTGTENATKTLLNEVVRRWDVRPKKTRFALTVFGDDARAKWELNSKTAVFPKLISAGIATINATHSFSNHAAAIDAGIDQFRMPPHRKVPDIFVLFADGKPNKDVRRLEPAIRRLMCQPHTCFAIVGINTRENSEEEAFFKYVLGCHKSKPCKDLFLFDTKDKKAPYEIADNLTRRLCDCAKKKPSVPRADAVTTFTIRIPEKTLADFGSRDELNRAVDEMLYDAAEATGVNPGRLTAIGIEDTLGNTVGDSVTTGHVSSDHVPDSTPPATLIEVMFEEPGRNIEPKSQESARELARIMKQHEGELTDQLARQGIANARIERIAIRQYDGNMPIIDVLEV